MDNKIVVYFPNTVLSVIIHFINSNLDRIAFTLVCKRWFHSIEKILTFKLNDDVVIVPNIENKYHMKSYINIFKRSLLLKENISFGINIDKEYYIHKHVDFYYETEQKKLSYLQFYEEQGIDFQNQKDELTIDEDIPIYVNTLVIGLFTRSLQSLQKVFELHPNISKLKFQCQPSQFGIIPEQIKSLTVTSRNAFNRYYTSGNRNQDEILLLPSKLEHLNIKDGNITVDCQSAVTTLKTILIDDNTSINMVNMDVIISRIQVFSSLTTIKIGSSWILRLKNFVPVLSTIYFNNEEQFHLHSPEDFPPSVTDIDFCDNSFYLQIGTLPMKTLRRLSLGLCKFKFYSSRNIAKHFFPEDSTIETLSLGEQYPENLAANLLPTSLKELNIARLFSLKPTIINSLPYGLEVLSIGMTEAKITNQLIPNTVRELSLHFKSTFKGRLDSNFIPNSVQILKLFDYGKNTNYKLPLPGSVKEVNFHFKSGTSIDRIQELFNHLPFTVGSIHFNFREYIVNFKRLNSTHLLVDVLNVNTNLTNCGIINSIQNFQNQTLSYLSCK